MERTKTPKLTNNQLLERITVLSTLSNRMGLAKQMSGQTYGGDRDMFSALGYPENLSFRDYYCRYDRQDIAKAIIDRPVNRTWKGEVEIIESDDDKDTVLEEAWEVLCDELSVKSILNRLDKLTGIGRYGVLLLGLNDTQVISDYSKPVVISKGLKLLYLKPLSEESAKISTFETDPSNARFGLPLLYTIQFQTSSETSQASINVHYSRIIHVVDDILESEIEGTPRLNSVFNRLVDLEKIVGGDGEIFWRNARPGYANKVDKDFQFTPEAQEKLMDQITEYENNLRRFLTVQGMELSALTQAISDPSPHVAIQVMMISSQTGIPQRVLMGTEEAKLAGSQDADEWASYISSRREEYVEPRILRPFINYLIDLGILPKPTTGSYKIKWEDLFAPSEKDKAEIGKTRSEALKNYASVPAAEATIPPEAFMEFFLGFDKDQIQLIAHMLDAELAKEPQITKEEEDEMILAEEEAKQAARAPKSTAKPIN